MPFCVPGNPTSEDKVMMNWAENVIGYQIVLGMAAEHGCRGGRRRVAGGFGEAATCNLVW